MKVLLVSYLFHPHEAGGAEQAVLDLANGLGHKGCRVMVLTAGNREERRELFPMVSVWRIAHRSPYFNDPRQARRNVLLRTAWRLLAAWNPLVFCKTVVVMRRFRPDVVHVHNFHGFSPAVFTAARLLAIPVVFTPHDYFAICSRYSLFKNGQRCVTPCRGCRLWARWVGFCMGRFHLLCLSQFSRGLLLRYLRPTSVLSRLLPSPLAAREIRALETGKQRLGSRPRTVFLFMGRLNELKGIPWLLQSFPRGVAAPALLLIVGAGPLRPRVEEFCRRHPANTKFLGEVSGERKWKLLLATDVLLCLSAAGDMSPLVIGEAFAFGIPVIGSATGAIPERVVPGETGWLVPHGDGKALATLVSAVCADPESRTALGRNCMRAALANDRELYWQEVLACFRAATATNPGKN